ncbi:succinate--CoA ligase subunit beta [candidate division WOR-1 bacterium RIFCSPHIGHO2_01_FULL_53_15]|uniref:Succinate--CoA ligase [ADP-forming] subunit beta n=1 Tax=candidate division WOR-1 bacterium RIFCSPHIGHO2_01_FULL_53_15 TaxID=1802564 RepID=A0A1F4Q3M2_UNCSA|nr:MAG: succinate--CoA ligase subunit beta [candidate division WOR-1 bacterium RIFCSPHIGHO2_01_FULL_53_15]OGC12711.1 MAG: succinate--CoA ligase subunit beta [candidate division WOR-1 bacterium RIFCSPHIGHO2_02_FULL_53_26]
MKLYEYQAKELLAKAGVPTPKGEVAETAEKAEKFAAQVGLPLAIKAQVLVGGRGKAGGIKIARTAEEVKTFSGQILNMKIKGLPVASVLVEKGLEIAKEYYLGITLDRTSKSNVLIFSAMGGIDIEAVALHDPAEIFRTALTRLPITFPPLSLGEGKKIEAIAEKLYELYLKTDATLAEINPLVKTKDGNFVAADAKIVIDDNALFRHPEFHAMAEEAEEDPLEAEAHRRKIAYVRLPGSIGILGNGAGLVMTTMDEVKRAGGEPACFLDLGGGSKAETVANCLELLTKDQNIKGIFFNIFGGITRCDEVVNGIIAAHDKVGVKVPMVIRLTGTREEEGKKLLARTTFLTYAASMTEGARKIVELAR